MVINRCYQRSIMAARVIRLARTTFRNNNVPLPLHQLHSHRQFYNNFLHNQYRFNAFLFRYQFSTLPSVDDQQKKEQPKETELVEQEMEQNTRLASEAELRRFKSTIKMLRKDLQEDLKEQKAWKKQLQLSTNAKTTWSVRVKNGIAFGWNLVVNPRELWRIILGGLKHTYHGFRLFGLESWLSAKYLAKMILGKPLLRKERQQMLRTVIDIFRLVPFSAFVIIPAMELLFPIYIKLFPRMMPSTFQNMSKEEEQYRIQLRAKVETAKFIQDTIEEIAQSWKDQGLGQGKQAYEFAQFLKKIRTGEGGYVNNEELFKFLKLFEDDLTLDNLSMVQLRALCRLLGISKMGTPEIIRFRLHMKLRELKADDRLIDKEGGVDVLSAKELQAACRARGMRAIGLSEERLRQQLRQWVELSQDDQVPPSLLLLSRAMYFPEEVDFTARIRSVLATLPKEIGDFKALTLKEIEGESDPQAKIELLKGIEAALKAEKDLRREMVEKKKKKEEREAAEELEGGGNEKQMRELGDGREETKKESSRLTEERREEERRLKEVEEMEAMTRQKLEEEEQRRLEKERLEVMEGTSTKEERMETRNSDEIRP